MATVRVSVQVAPPASDCRPPAQGFGQCAASGALWHPIAHPRQPGHIPAQGKARCLVLDDTAGAQPGESKGSATAEVSLESWVPQRPQFYWG
ncbi:hypothetical protein HA052_22925 [Chromobacterium haemolyticum]|uniref:Uncharacterized protein n=1 Tax=Chromobacterium fluminis TaxID=3044269 RepID=A0ABX0LAH0_9NEIS|nr:hypothetical protein [Chromobacterium haemolyticum]NHR08048.1 hypothetical protein [Chromobacterium haemolyticum]